MHITEVATVFICSAFTFTSKPQANDTQSSSQSKNIYIKPTLGIVGKTGFNLENFLQSRNEERVKKEEKKN